MSGQFEKLLADLGSAQTETDTLAKSLTAGDGAGTSQAAAAAAGAGDAGAGAAGAGEGGAGAAAAASAAGTGGDAGAGAGEGAPMLKSMTVKLADGTEQEVIDAEQLIKSFNEAMATQQADVVEAMTKAVGVINAQGALIKSLTEKVQALSNEGRGRKTLVSVTEKLDATTLAKGGATAAAGAGAGAGGESITSEDFMLKAESAFGAKKITGLEFTKLDVMRRNGTLPTLVTADPALAKKVLTA